MIYKEKKAISLAIFLGFFAVITSCTKSSTLQISFTGPKIDGIRLIGLVKEDGSEPLEILREISTLGEVLYWAPNGMSAVVLREEDQHFYIVDVEHSKITRCLDCDIEAHNLAFSPTGDLIALSTDSGLFITDVNQSSKQLIASNPNPGRLSWSPNGDSIVFESWEAYESSRIILVQLDSRATVDLTAQYQGQVEAFLPVWSPTGDRIAFQLHRNGFYLMSVNPDGSEMTKVADLQFNYELYTPGMGERVTWSPDGSTIAFMSTTDNGDQEILATNLSGDSPINLTQHPGSDYSPAWSPDGRKIAFVSRRDGNPEIYVMDADGSNPINLTNSPVIPEANPAWRPRPQESAQVSLPLLILGGALLTIAIGAGLGRIIISRR